MVEEPDIRLDGTSHKQILEWVQRGRAGDSTTILEQWLQDVVTVLNRAADEVNGAIRKASAGQWEGPAADSAHNGTTSLLNYVDELEAHGTANRYSAMGQSGESAATRDRVPPIPLNRDGPPTILATTVDPGTRISAQRKAEDQAREVMAEYREATRHRLASLPSVPPVPAVVLDTGTEESTPSAGGNAQTRKSEASAPRSAGNTEGGSSAATTGKAGPVEVEPVDRVPARSVHEAPATTPQSTEAPVAGSVPARGDPVAPGGERPVVGGGGPTAGEQPDVVRTKGGDGPKSGAGRPLERQPVVHREVSGGRSGGQASSGVLGGAATPPGDKGEEHHNRYHVPSGEPFESDEDDELPEGFFVVPDVIGGPE